MASLCSELLDETETRKRKKELLSSSSEDSFSSSPVHKRSNSKMSFEESLVALQKGQEAIQVALKALASKDDIKAVRVDLYGEINALNNRLDNWRKEYDERLARVEGRFFDFENRLDDLAQENIDLRTKNAALEEDIKKCKRQVNDLEQYGRRWNIKIWNVEDNLSETASETTKKACEVFTNICQIKVSPNDLEACHRLPAKDQTKRRAIIARFRDRGLRDRVWGNKSKCKNKGVSISEDLTFANFDMLTAAFKHAHCKSTWTINGKCFGKLTNDAKVRFHVGDDVNEVIRIGMRTPIASAVESHAANPPNLAEPTGTEESENME